MRIVVFNTLIQTIWMLQKRTPFRESLARFLSNPPRAVYIDTEREANRFPPLLPLLSRLANIIAIKEGFESNCGQVGQTLKDTRCAFIYDCKIGLRSGLQGIVMVPKRDSESLDIIWLTEKARKISFVKLKLTQHGCSHVADLFVNELAIAVPLGSSFAFEVIPFQNISLPPLQGHCLVARFCWQVSTPLQMSG